MARLRKAPTKALRDQFTSYSPNETLDKDKCATKPQIEPRSSATRKTNHVETIVIYDSDEEEKEHSYAKEEEERKEGLKYLDLSAEEADTDESQSADRADDYGLGNESDDNDHDAEKAISQLEEAIETTTLKLKKKRTLRPLRVNRVNTQIQSRRVSTREVSRYNEYLSDDENMSAGSGDYEKENDEKGLFNETKSSARRKSRLSELRRRSGRNSRMPSLSTQYLSEGDGEDRSADDEEFDSLDDFIVGDDEDISYFESAEENDEESEDEIIVKPKTPGRRLLRGRKPSSPRENSSTQNNTKVNPNIGVNIDNAHDSSDVDGLIDILHHTTLSKPEPQTTQVINRKPQKSLKGRKYKPKAMKFDNDDDGSNAPSSHNSQDSKNKKKAVDFVTPPSTPSKPRLQSPRKTPSRIPPSPYRPSIDAFWSHEIISSWNDKFRPAQTPRKGQSDFKIFSDNQDEEDNNGNSAPSSPEKAPPRSPNKGKESPLKTIAAVKKTQRREFDAQKNSLAETFFKELDDAVTGGEIQKLAAPAGGVRIVWSKTLNRTAGRANWKREYVKGNKHVIQEASSCLAAEGDSQEPASKVSSKTSAPQTSYKHYASIELADKVVDSEDRLLNTLAHEYCHLANFMISNVRDQPHGANFKAWAQKCIRALRDHPVYGGRVEITTKHSYAINFKYIWTCVGCAHEYGRHSRSIDPEKSRCGKCKGMLMQTQPKPRKTAAKKDTSLKAFSGVTDAVATSMGQFRLDK